MLQFLSFFSLQDSLAQGTKDVLRGIQTALAQAPTTKPPLGTQQPAAIIPIYNISRVNRVKVAVPMETCAIAQQTPTKRDVQVGLRLFILQLWESGCQRCLCGVKNVKCFAGQIGHLKEGELHHKERLFLR